MFLVDILQSETFTQLPQKIQINYLKATHPGKLGIINRKLEVIKEESIRTHFKMHP